MKKLLFALILQCVFVISAWAAVDINAATQSELEAVKGIGPSKAKAIIEHREKNGPFKTLDDLTRVKGFGKASVAKLRSELNVGTQKAEAVGGEAARSK